MPIKWTRLHEERRNAILALLTRDAAPIYSSAEIEVVKSLPFALKIRRLFPQFIRPEVRDAPFHAAIDEKRHAGGRIEVTCGARNTAKSTRIMVCATALDICERRFRYIVFGARTVDAAAEKADIVRLLLEHSPMLRAVYGGNLDCELGHDEEADWVANGCRLRSLGIGQSIRGALAASGDRVQCFRGDDLDDMMLNRSRERQDNLWDWLRGEVYQALADPGGTSVFHVLCNMFNRTCMAARAEDLARERPDLCGFERYPLLGPDGESTWPGRFSTQQVLKMMALAGPSRARTEYLCLPANDESRFQPEWFKDYRLADLDPERRRRMRKVIRFDPSFSATASSDFKAIIKLADEPGRPELYTLAAWIRKATARAAAEEVCRMWAADPDAAVVIESNSGATDVYTGIFNSLAAEGWQVPYIRYVWTSTPKEIDICQCEADLSRGLCCFDRTVGDQQLLVNQFCDWGATGAHDDGPDAWSKARKRLRMLARSAEPQPEPTRADLLREAGIDKWNVAENPAIWQEAEI